MFCYLYSVKEKTGSGIIIIATAVGGVLFLCIAFIVLLIKYKRWKRPPKVSTLVNIQSVVETPQELLPIDQVNYLRMVRQTTIDRAIQYEQR
jgi:hypothetical protein